MKKLLLAVFCGILSMSASVAATASIENSGEAVTVCYYGPKIYMGPGQRGFTVTLEGHVSCAQEYNFGRLVFTDHTYR